MVSGGRIPRASTISIVLHKLPTDQTIGLRLEQIKIVDKKPVKVIGVIPNSPADRAGVKKGWEVSKVRNVPIQDFDITTICHLVKSGGNQVEIEFRTSRNSPKNELDNNVSEKALAAAKPSSKCIHLSRKSVPMTAKLNNQKETPNTSPMSQGSTTSGSPSRQNAAAKVTVSGEYPLPTDFMMPIQEATIPLQMIPNMQMSNIPIQAVSMPNVPTNMTMSMNMENGMPYLVNPQMNPNMFYVPNPSDPSQIDPSQMFMSGSFVPQ